MYAPIVSVVMSAYNEEAAIACAIQSILYQNLTNFELILIDDSSTDTTLSIMEKYGRKDERIIILKNSSNIGLPASLNKGIAKSTSEFIARMDADDYSYPDRLHLQYQFLQKFPEISVVGSNAIIINEAGAELSKTKMPLTHSIMAQHIIRKCPLIHPSVMYRKSFILSMHGYDEKLKKKQDYDLWMRGCKLFKYANIEKPLIKYRVQNYKSIKTDLYGIYVRLLNALRQKKIITGIYWALVTFTICQMRRVGYISKSQRKPY